MDFNLQIFFICVATIVSVTGLQPRDKCKATDSQCIKIATQTVLEDFALGIPEFGIESIDPMHIDKVFINLAGLNLILSNVTVKGIKKSTFESIRMNMEKKILTFSYKNEQLTLKSFYTASGRLLILPISGDGETIIKIKQSEVKWVIPFEVIKNKQDQDVINLKSYKFDSEVTGGVSFQLTNLFNGNKQLSEALLKFMNESWKLLFQEFGGSMLKTPHEIIYQSIKKYFLSQPLTDVISL